VEEAHTVTGEHKSIQNSRRFLLTLESATATAYIFKEIFDEYTYHHEAPPATLPSDGTQDAECTMFEIQLNILVDCLNIFGSANLPPSGTATKRWRKAEDGGDRDDRDDRDDKFTSGGGRIDQYFNGSAGEGKRTGMRMKYLGAGYPLTLFL
jgi:cell cycle checkpoint protein